MKKEKINGLDALVYFDNVHNEYTIVSAEEGGAIITNDNLSEAKKDWANGMRLSKFAKKVLKLKK